MHLRKENSWLLWTRDDYPESDFLAFWNISIQTDTPGVFLSTYVNICIENYIVFSKNYFDYDLIIFWKIVKNHFIWPMIFNLPNLAY